MLAPIQRRAIYNLSPSLLRSFQIRLYLVTFTGQSYSTKSVVPRTTISPTPIRAPPPLALNPPSSTRPPPLNVPSRLPDQPIYKYYFTIGKTYANFYKTGFKNLYSNYFAAKSIAQRLESTTYEEDLRNGLISRAEWHLVQRQRADLLRVPLFLLVFIICGEFTPLVAIFFSSAVPRSLWVPKQVESSRAKVEARRREVFRNPSVGLDLNEHKKATDRLSRAEVLHIGRSLGLYSSLWDRIGFPPMPLIGRRVKRRMELVELDDLAIRRDGDVDQMDAAEVELAAEMRGLDVLGRYDVDLRSNLRKWLRRTGELAKRGLSARRLYLTRPSAW